MSLRAHPVVFSDIWPTIENVVLNVLHQERISAESWQTTFFDIYKVCVAPETLVGTLYDRLKLLLQNHAKEIYKQLSTVETQHLLTDYFNHWTTYKTAAYYIDSLFSYLNTQHLKKSKKPINPDSEEICQPGLEIKDLCFHIWNQELITPLKKTLVNLLMQDIEADRRGSLINHTIVSGVVHSFAEVEEFKKDDTLSLYKETFETHFLKATGDFYGLEAERLRQQLDCSGYMKKVLQIIDLETMNCTKFIHSSSKDRIISEIRTRMVANHSAYLYQESEKMVASDNWQDLNLVYRLLKPIDGALKALIQQVQDRIIELGLEAMKEVKTSNNPPRAFVESFIQVYKKHHDLIRKTFNSDPLFASALDKACSTIINYRFDLQQPCRSPELLAKYCDSLLRKPSNSSQHGGLTIKNLTESEIDEKLSQSITVFKYIDDKDVFQKFYSKSMARRLILSQLASMDAEESMINKLKLVCGYEFTAKLQRMFTGIGTSNEQGEKFNVYLRKNNIDLGLSFSIYILQNGSWPLGQSSITTFQLPEIFARSVKSFEEYYCTTFNGRVLTWLYHHCTADLKLCYTLKKQYFITMQTFHAAILLLFEDKNELTFDEIANKTELSEDQLVKHLQGFLDFKILLLIDEPKVPCESVSISSLPPTTSTSSSANTQQVTDDKSIISKQVKRSDNGSPTNTSPYNFRPETKIALNLDFSYKRAKFKITCIQRDSQYQQLKEQNESDQTHAAVDEDRKLYIQAAIVRVMKSRKMAKHNQLVQEVINLTKSHFVPSVPMIKKCIEILIEKQYLEKNANTPDEYKYLA